MSFLPIILAAGQGTRMNSSLPKVLHSIGGTPMLRHVINSCRKLDVREIAVIYGHGGDQVKETCESDDIIWVLQQEQKGTGHAVSQARDVIQDDSTVIIAYGDVPLIKTETLNKLADKLTDATLSVLTTRLKEPFGYGRIIRNEQSKIQYIVEEKDADEIEKKVNEVNTGFIAAKGADLKRWLKQIQPNNNQGEYYLTDCIALAVNEGGLVEAVVCEDPFEVQGVNNRIQQATLERAYQARKAEKMMLDGVTLLDPSRIDIRGNVKTGKDVTIDVNAVFIGNVELKNGVSVASGCVISNSIIGENTIIKANSVIESSIIHSNCEIGPFARIRPNSDIKDNAKVGNFVETKNSVIGFGSKVSHLSYIGDTEMGDNVNIGAGTITCNYDGANKFKTTIENDVFVGSDTQLIAPVTVKEGSTIGAGSTITKDTPPNELSLSRAKQMTVKGWQRPVKKNDKNKGKS